MDRDSEELQRSFLRLILDLNLAAAGEEAINALFGVGADKMAGSPLADLNQPGRAVLNFDSSSSVPPSTSPDGEAVPFKSGELPAVQDRFYSLLKRRLQAEIQRNPPLFPWESEVADYQSEGYALLQSEAAPDLVPAAAKVGAAPVWSAQLDRLNLPVPMPQAVLTQLLERCQSAVQTSLREGARLVRAVEEMFPGQTPALNQLAGLVMVSPARSGAIGDRLQAKEDFPSSYEAAVPPQQMVLSLLAAREILSLLTLPLTPDQPQAEREWLTEAGPLQLQARANYSSAGIQLQVQTELPGAGSIILRVGEFMTAGQRPNAGRLHVELPDLQAVQTALLEVSLGEAQPLVFALPLTTEP